MRRGLFGLSVAAMTAIVVTSLLPSQAYADATRCSVRVIGSAQTTCFFVYNVGPASYNGNRLRINFDVTTLTDYQGTWIDDVETDADERLAGRPGIYVSRAANPGERFQLKAVGGVAAVDADLADMAPHSGYWDFEVGPGRQGETFLFHYPSFPEDPVEITVPLTE